MLWRDEIVFMEKDNNMKFSDFEDIQQDEFSLGRPTFPTPKGGTLTVVGWSGKYRTQKFYLVQCSECMKDRELNGDGVYKLLKGALETGGVPCSCSRRVRWSPEQYEILIKRVSKGSKIKFLGLDYTSGKGRPTVRIFCHEHGEYNNTTVVVALKTGMKCPRCSIGVRVARQKALEPSGHAEITKDILEVVPESYTLEETSKKRGSAYMIKVKCSVCASDMYTKAGLCDGIFYTDAASLRRKQLPCRCSKRPYYTKDQLNYKAKAACKKLGYKLVGWVDEIKTLGKIRYICPRHGLQTAIMGNIVAGSSCPECAGRSQQQAYINIVSDEKIPVAIKLGISVNSTRRLKQQNSKNLFQMESIGIWSFEKVEDCKRAESECKRKLECGILSARELKDGWSETTHLQNLEKVIEIYEKWGGIREESDE